MKSFWVCRQLNFKLLYQDYYFLTNLRLLSILKNVKKISYPVCLIIIINFDGLDCQNFNFKNEAFFYFVFPAFMFFPVIFAREGFASTFWNGLQ